MILHYSPLVKYVAGRVSVGLPPNVEQADFVSSGVFGLIDAIEKFDIDREIKFETYAITRIRGAMIDELRALDWIPRSVRQKARNVERAYATLEARLRRTPSECEVAAEMGIAVEELHAVFSQLSLANVVALEELLHVGGEGGDRLSLMDTLEDTAADNPVEVAEDRELRRFLARAINTLPTGRRPSSRSTTTRGSRSPRSGTCWVSPRAGSARSTPNRCSSCGRNSPLSGADRGPARGASR